MENVTSFCKYPPLAVARSLLTLAARQKHERNQVHRIVQYNNNIHVHSLIDELIVLIPPAGIVQPGQGHLLRRALYGIENLGENLLKNLGQRRMDSELSVSGNAVPHWPCSNEHVSQ